MSATTWWILAGSVFVGLIIAAIAAIITWRRIQAIKRRALQAMIPAEQKTVALAFERTTHGKLLHIDEKTRKLLHVGDTEMEYALNTFTRNNFASFTVIGAESDYEKRSLTELAGGGFSRTDYDFALVLMEPDFAEKFAAVFRALRPKGVIFITNTNAFKRGTKTLLADLKLMRVRHEFNKVGAGVILVAK